MRRQGALAWDRGIMIERGAHVRNRAASPQVRHPDGGHHEFVNGFIMLPNCRQARAKLECDPEDCCLRARSAVERRNSQPPSPPEFGWIGPVGTQGVATRVRVRVRFNPNNFRAGASRPVFCRRADEPGSGRVSPVRSRHQPAKTSGLLSGECFLSANRCPPQRVNALIVGTCASVPIPKFASF
jgi:hypothetical protein